VMPKKLRLSTDAACRGGERRRPQSGSHHRQSQAPAAFARPLALSLTLSQAERRVMKATEIARRILKTEDLMRQSLVNQSQRR
jgi:hypothetical protein